MFIVEDLNQNQEMVIDFKDLHRQTTLNGERLLSFTLFNTTRNEHSYTMVLEESYIYFYGEQYVIKNTSERNFGKNGKLKLVKCVQKFYADMANSQYMGVIGEKFTGRMNIVTFFGELFNGTLYQNKYELIGEFPINAADFENLGRESRSSMLAKGLERYEVEIINENDRLTIKNRVGEQTDFQFRYSFNIKSISRDVDTTNLATRITGYGKDGLKRVYNSPNQARFGVIEAKTIEDDRFTNPASLDAYLKQNLQDVPYVTVTIEYRDLRKSGYRDVAKVGNHVFLIYEPLNLDLDTRITQIDEYYDHDLEPYDTHVTFSNNPVSWADVMLGEMEKTLRGIVNTDGLVKYDAMNAFLKNAAVAINNTFTEVQYPVNGGITLVDKNNPNRVIRLTSDGIGVSNDAGQTYRTAITGDGVAAERIYGKLISGTQLRTSNTSNYVSLDSQYMRLYQNNIVRMYHGYYQTSNGIQPTIILGSDSNNVESGSLMIYQFDDNDVNSRAAGISMVNGRDGDGSLHYSGTLYMTIDGKVTLTGDKSVSLSSGGDANVYHRGDFNLVKDGFIYASFQKNYDDVDLFLNGVRLRYNPNYAGEPGFPALQIISKAADGSTVFKNIKAGGYYGSYVDVSNGAVGRVTAKNMTAQQTIDCNRLITNDLINNSLSTLKTNILSMDDSAFDEVMSWQLKSYNLISEVEEIEKYNASLTEEDIANGATLKSVEDLEKRFGLVLPAKGDKQGVNVYSMATKNARAFQVHVKKTDERIKELEEQNKLILEQNKILMEQNEISIKRLESLEAKVG
ncbi:phage minor structural protein [Bacillus cereus VDM053]|nr:phage minor structural protein [Bacillus cereus VDM053]